MKVVISSGHGKYVRGASGYIDEVDEARRVVDRVTTILNGMGVGTTSFHDDVSQSQNENLNRIVDFHNSKTRDWDISVHFNAYETTSKPMGCEVLYVSSTGQEKADEVVDAICLISGLTNRGPKQRTDLFFLNNTEQPAILIETCFVDSQADVNIYRDQFDHICYSIAEAVSGQEVPGRPEIPERPEAPGSDDDAIMDIAMNSEIADYQWKDRGKSPAGYIQGFALTWAAVVRRFYTSDRVVMEMAKANTHNDDKDALSWYNSNFAGLGMTNEYNDIHTLRHLFVLLLGLGMRESSGKHCVGTDTSAEDWEDRPSNEHEAGLYQTSYNAHSCCDEFDVIMEEYIEAEHEGYMETFAVGVTCGTSDWQNYGSGDGAKFQQLCKEEPAFAVESCALVLRNLGGEEGHYGPIRRKEAEIKREADEMLLEVQRYVEDKL